MVSNKGQPPIIITTHYYRNSLWDGNRLYDYEDSLQSLEDEEQGAQVPWIAGRCPEQAEHAEVGKNEGSVLSAASITI